MLELKPNTIPNNYEKDSCWLCENDYKSGHKKEVLVVRDHCPLTSNFGRLEND